MNRGYSIVIQVHSHKYILMGIKCDGIDESMRNSSIHLYNNDEAIEIMTQKIYTMRSTIKL